MSNQPRPTYRSRKSKKLRGKQKNGGRLVNLLGIEPQPRVRPRDVRTRGGQQISKVIRKKFRPQYSWFRNLLEENDQEPKARKSRRATVMDRVVAKTWAEAKLPLAVGAMIFGAKYFLGAHVQSFIDSTAWHSLLNVLLTMTIVLYLQNLLGRIVKNVRDEDRAKRTRKSFKELEGSVGAIQALAWSQQSGSVRRDQQLTAMNRQMVALTEKLGRIERQLNASLTGTGQVSGGETADSHSSKLKV